MKVHFSLLNEQTTNTENVKFSEQARRSSKTVTPLFRSNIIYTKTTGIEPDQVYGIEQDQAMEFYHLFGIV